MPRRAVVAGLGALLATHAWAGVTVSLTAPANGSVHPAGSNITLSASASANQGYTVSKVEFFQGTTLIGTDTTAPYSTVWTGVPAGNHSLTAKATAIKKNNPDQTATSSPVNITVNASVVQLHFIHVDHLNTPRLVANAQQQTVWRWDQQEPFGNNPADQNPSGLGAFDLPLRLPGQYFDKETNLHYNYFRDYDPSIGRYVESDPIGLRGGINGYGYVALNPLSFSDVRGLDNPLLNVMLSNTQVAPPFPCNPTFGPSPANCDHYPDPFLRAICMGAPNTPSMNCSRKCLQQTFPGIRPFGSFAYWIIPQHPVCWWECYADPIDLCIAIGSSVGTAARQ
jgi:RHS repeat-associated protein